MKDPNFVWDEDLQDFLNSIVERYCVPDVEFFTPEIPPEWLYKTSFLEDKEMNQLIEHFKGKFVYEENKVAIPHYESRYLMPGTQGKFINTQIDYYAGDLLRFTVIVGMLRKGYLYPHHYSHEDILQREQKITLSMNYQYDRGRWGHSAVKKKKKKGDKDRQEEINPDIVLWEDLFEEIKAVQLDERTHQAMLHATDVLDAGWKVAGDFFSRPEKERLLKLLQYLKKEEHLLRFIPKLLQAFKVITQKEVDLILSRLEAIYSAIDHVVEIMPSYKTNPFEFNKENDKMMEFQMIAKEFFERGFFVERKGDSIYLGETLAYAFAKVNRPKIFQKSDYLDGMRAYALTKITGISTHVPINPLIQHLS